VKVTQKLPPIVWNGYTSLIWVDGTKREVFSWCSRFCHDIEKSWFSKRH